MRRRLGSCLHPPPDPSSSPALNPQEGRVRCRRALYFRVCACQNPIVGYWNPLGLGGDHLSLGLGSGFWNQDYAAAIGFLRESEIKHGRVAMAAFVGFVVQSYGLHWPWKLTSEVSFADISAVGGPGAQWDAISLEGKLQIFGFIFLLEGIRESTYALDKCGEKHYMRGGKPGFFPSLKAEGVVPHPVPLDLFDPFGFSKSASPEKKVCTVRKSLSTPPPPPPRLPP